MSNAVPPAGTSPAEVRIVVKYPLVDVAEHKLALLGAEYGHRDDADVAVVRLGLVVCGRLMTWREQVPVTCSPHTKAYLYRDAEKINQYSFVSISFNT